MPFHVRCSRGIRPHRRLVGLRKPVRRQLEPEPPSLRQLEQLPEQRRVYPTPVRIGAEPHTPIHHHAAIPGLHHPPWHRHHQALPRTESSSRSFEAAFLSQQHRGHHCPAHQSAPPPGCAAHHLRGNRRQRTPLDAGCSHCRHSRHAAQPSPGARLRTRTQPAGQDRLAGCGAACRLWTAPFSQLPPRRVHRYNNASPSWWQDVRISSYSSARSTTTPSIITMLLCAPRARRLYADLRRLEAQIEGLQQADATIRQQVARLTTVQGIGRLDAAGRAARSRFAAARPERGSRRPGSLQP